MTPKAFKCGLVVGKFSPLHKGHEYLIQHAFDQCDDVVIISYSRPEFASCSSNVRERWIKARFPSAIVLSIDAATVESWRADSAWTLEMPRNTEGDQVHRQFTYSLIAKKLGLKIDAIFTSEGYGDGFAKFLSDRTLGFGYHIGHICVDLNREKVPVSGSLMRSSPAPNTDLIDDEILIDFSIQKICFLGGESTGKSTLSQVLSEKFKEPLVAEYGRELWEEKNGDLTPGDLIDICTVQTSREDIAQQKAKNFIFCDTSPLTTLCYSEALFHQRCNVINAYAERPYHHIFLCEPDFPFMQDGTRRDDDFRLLQHNWYLRELANKNMDFIRLSGSISQRVEKVTSIITKQSF
ncbi:AAA family ATPase [Grimontia marina]|uniref:Trifunctional NAD biosynthesis/regulator protein NadR n=1 Tax=Grimontia marina TaxID=646534 RepID=A0A128FJG5_9GAMM|nr:AAA family ATPase [Grimontia marina]CZF86928.1 Trifunctional NAD biosynthesis/regulator protein NadR [Grimontia marina]